ncbi:hypothetical protein HPQ64_11990 [Rhizobiales bacterium]|uniref:hypothetical protein n=1 Tax=Hongsoonwoonella zoysiae TaxID=2821844 RepID=UPI001560B13E|nr:hypothetical protein [Hongsoonwoonella zoysiae]NRG18412.1 hypothetical protein [Hongsoonwoonella zoysiae]
MCDAVAFFYATQGEARLPSLHVGQKAFNIKHQYCSFDEMHRQSQDCGEKIMTSENKKLIDAINENYNTNAFLSKIGSCVHCIRVCRNAMISVWSLTAFLFILNPLSYGLHLGLIVSVLATCVLTIWYLVNAFAFAGRLGMNGVSQYRASKSTMPSLMTRREAASVFLKAAGVALVASAGLAGALGASHANACCQCHDTDSAGNCICYRCTCGYCNPPCACA